MSDPDELPRTLIIFGAYDRVVLRDEQIDRYLELGKEREKPDPVALAREVAGEAD